MRDGISRYVRSSSLSSSSYRNFASEECPITGGEDSRWWTLVHTAACAEICGERSDWVAIYGAAAKMRGYICTGLRFSYNHVLLILGAHGNIWQFTPLAAPVDRSSDP